MVSEDSGSSGQDSKTLERAPEWTERLGVVEKNGKGLEVPLQLLGLSLITLAGRIPTTPRVSGITPLGLPHLQTSIASVHLLSQTVYNCGTSYYVLS